MASQARLEIPVVAQGVPIFVPIVPENLIVLPLARLLLLLKPEASTGPNARLARRSLVVSNAPHDGGGSRVEENGLKDLKFEQAEQVQKM